MLDKNIMANLEQIKKSCLVIDIESSSQYPDGREVNISADFENYKKFAKVKWVGLYSYLYDKIYVLNAQQDVQEIMKLLQEHNTLIGFNSEEFDFPILVNNGYVGIEKKYLQVDIMQIYGTSNFKNKSGYAYKNRATLMDYKLKNNSLRCVAETMGVENLKGEIDYKIFIKNQWTPEEEQEIKTYLQSDVLATKQLFEKLWDYWLPFAELLDVKDIYNLSWIRSSIASLTYKAACKVLATEPTYADKTDEIQDIGGNVILPTREETYNGYHVDVGSLYPHMFCMANLTAEVNPENVSSKRKIWHGNEVFQVKGYYDITERHPLATYISEKLKERIHLKETDPKNPFIYTLKIFLNGLYGVIASGIFEKVHTKNAGYDCCYLGQQVQQLMKEMLEQFGFEIVQGDTDALDFIAKEGTENTKEYVQDCLNQITEVIKENFPFPVDTFKINIEYCFDYLMVPFSEEPIVGEDGKNLKKGNRLILERKGKKKNYLVIYKDKGEAIVKLVGLPIIKDNATTLGMKIYEEVLKPEIIKNMRAKFPASYIQKVINDYLKKPEIIELLSQEYKVKAANSYKNNCIQKQISQAYFCGNEGVIRLVKNSKVGKCGAGTKYATIEEVTNAKLTSDELDLDKVNQELSPFVLFEEVKTPVEAAESSKTPISSQDNAKIEESPVQAPKKRGRPKGSKKKDIGAEFSCKMPHM